MKLKTFFIRRIIKSYEMNLNYEKYWSKRLSVQRGVQELSFIVI